MSRIFSSKCKKCKEFLEPFLIHALGDRIKLVCPNNHNHPSLIKLLRGKTKKQWSRYSKLFKKSMELNDYFVEAMVCYLDYIGSEISEGEWVKGSDEESKCRSCPAPQKQFCEELEMLHYILCHPK